MTSSGQATAQRLHPLQRSVSTTIAPLIFATLTVGIAGHGTVKNLGKIGLKTIIYFEIATTIALVLGLVMANVLKPGAGFNIDLNSLSMTTVESMQSASQQGMSLTQMLVHSVPVSIVEAMANGDLLQIVVFAIFLRLQCVPLVKKHAQY